jgi:pyridoxamine 5'-phosphate oxidase family protein
MSAHQGLSDLELRWVRRRPPALARIATVGEDGMPHVVPGQWAWDGARVVFVLGGRDVPATVRAANVRRTGKAAMTVDGVDRSGGWAPWALLVRGRASVDDDAGAIVLHPDQVTSWGLQHSITEGEQRDR